MTALIRKAALSAAGAVFAGGMIAGPAAAIAAPESPTTTSVAVAERAGNNERQLPVRYEAQPNFYYCGPAAARNALTTMDKHVTQDELAKIMGTTENGTDSAHLITKALNTTAGTDLYRTVELPDASADDAQTDRLRTDLTRAIDNGRAIVANIAGTATDTDGDTHSFEGGHYISVTGYRDHGNQAKIADSADPDKAEYWITTEDLADWIATRGYSA
ncbi:Peptidase_C39 like family protein [Micromonospora nigra]|uniref:Peptidase_C39 like family protein n=2 Tax=Micromonospora nigra TaxID=145857 RepID=A0A1C6R8T0_9ACTN|nr:Peptidase_C39 like family protein [Micromonospora nigra]